jgi:hypothetical protein
MIERAVCSNQYRNIRCQGKKNQVLCWHWFMKGPGYDPFFLCTAVWWVSSRG